MAFASAAQKKKFAELVTAGKMSQETYDKHDKETDHSRLPERVQTVVTAGGVKSFIRRRHSPV